MTTLNNRGPVGFFSTWPAVSPRPEDETRTEEIRKNIVAISRRAAPSRALPEAKRETLISIAVALMEMMESPWNGEGPLRAGFRARLCLEGWQWADADNAADIVVQNALRRLGCAERPTWEMGQPDFVHSHSVFIEREHCLACGEKIPDDRTGGKMGRARVIYCSDRCRINFCQMRRRTHFEKLSLAEHLARCASRREATLVAEINCEHCAKPFRPGYNLMRRRYCSPACKNAAAVKRGPRNRNGIHQLHECICSGCGKTFSTHVAKHKYCSPACYQDMRKRRAATNVRGVEQQCEVCATIFRVHSIALGQRTCSRRCGGILSRRGAKPEPGAAPASDAPDGPETERPQCRAA